MRGKEKAQLIVGLIIEGFCELMSDFRFQGLGAKLLASHVLASLTTVD